MADGWQLPADAVVDAPPDPVATGAPAPASNSQTSAPQNGGWSLPAGIKADPLPEPVSTATTGTSDAGSASQWADVLNTGVQKAGPAFLGMPNTLGRLGDWALNKTGLASDNGPGWLTRHTYSSDEIDQALYDLNNKVVNQPLGLPDAKPAQPATYGQKVAQDIATGVPLALGGGGGLLSMAAREAANLGSTVAADTAAKYFPDSPGVQLVAGLLGAYPGARIEGRIIPTLTGATSKAQNLQQSFNDLSIPSNVFTTGQGAMGKATANVLSRLPGTAGPVSAGMERTVDRSGQAANALADTLGPAATAEEGGNALRSGVNNYRDSFQNQSEALYDEFNNKMDQGKPVDLTNTLAALNGPVDRFPSSPELGAQLTNSTLQKYADILTPGQKTIPPVYSSVLDQDGNPILLQAAQKVQTGGTLTFPELQELRSTIGKQISDPMMINDIPRADLKGVYAGISNDLENAARAQGPEALTAFQRANQFYRDGMNTVDELEPLLSGSPENAFAKINAAAGQTGAANAGLLQSLKSNLPSQDWNNVGAAVIRRLGTPTAGAHDLAGPAFSPTTFATNWGKLSDAAKDTLFGDLWPDLDKLAQVSNAQKNVAKFANHSNTATHLGIGGLIAAGAEHVPELIHNPHMILPTILGGVAAYGGANAVGRALMMPGFARFLYRTSDLTGPQATEQAVRQLLSVSRLNTGLQPVAQQVAAKLNPPTTQNADATLGGIQ